MTEKFISDSIKYIGVDDPDLTLFESQYVLENGMAYNSYLIDDDEIAVMDAVDARKIDEWMDNVNRELAGRKPSYLVVLHVEPDHSAGVKKFLETYPEAKVVGNAKTFTFLSQFFSDFNFDDRKVVVKDADTLKLGKHTLTFLTAPMVHWPETMVTLDQTANVLFSGDAFGCFGALCGAFVDTDMNCDIYWDEMRRYYSNIVGKYGVPVQQALKKLAGVQIDYICSTHGPVWHEHIARVIEAYDRMSRYDTDRGVVICYGSMYGNTERAAEVIARAAAQAGVRNIVMHDVSRSDHSYILSDIFKYDTIVLGAPTYNNGIYPQMQALIDEIAERGIKNHRLAVFGSFTWAGQTVKKILEANETRLKFELVGTPVEIKQSLNAETEAACEALGRALA